MMPALCDVLCAGAWNGVTTLLCPTFPISERSHLCLKVPRLCAVALLVRAMLRWKWVWSVGGMVLTGENRSTGRKICSTSTSSLTNPTWPDPGLNPDLCIAWLGTAVSHEIDLKVQFVPLSEHCLTYKNLSGEKWLLIVGTVWANCIALYC